MTGGGRGVPFVSVVLPVRNEGRHIEACLDGLVKQSYPRDAFEIIVADGASTDDTRERVTEFAALHAHPVIRLVDNPKGTVSPALNAAIRAARGVYVVRMDGHAVPAIDYVERCVDALERTGAGNVGGRISPAGATEFGEAVALAQTHRLGAGDAKFHFAAQAQDVDTVYLGAFPRSVFAKVGLFDETLRRNQDYEMNVRIRGAGLRVHLDPAIRSQYVPRGSPRALWSQYFQYGWWKVVTLRRHPTSWRWRQIVPPAFVAVVGSSLVGAPFNSWLAAVLLLASVPYALGILGATLGVSRRVPWRIALRFAAAVSIIHFAFGAGFWLSLITGSRVPYGDPGPPRIPRLES